MTNRFSRPAVTVATAVAMLLSGSAAFAQGVDDGGLEEITVTAQRREENLQNVPVSVSAVSGAVLSERNITDLSQMEGLAPGFTFGRSGNDARPAMRGVRTENVAVNGDTTIGYFIDGIYQSRAQQALAGFVDVARVEIQRGPQGTLYGRNTFGGNVSVITNAPQFDELKYSFGLTAGENSRFRFDGMLNLPVNDIFALRIAAAIDRNDGWVQNDFAGGKNLFDEDVKYFRVAARLKPNDRFDAVLRVDKTTQGGYGGSAFGYKQAGSYFDLPTCSQLFNTTPVILNVRPGNRDAVNDCTRTAALPTAAVGTSVDLGIPLYAANDAYRIDTDYVTFRDLDATNATLDATWDAGPVKIRSITGYADFEVERSSDTDFSASTIGIDYQLTAAKTFSQELQLLSDGDGPVSYVAGYYYFKDELQGIFINQQLPRTIRSAAGPNVTLAQNGNGAYDQQEPETTSNAVYGQLTFKATDRLSLTAGVRYTKDDKDFKFANANSVLPTAVSTAGAFVGDAQPDARLINVPFSFAAIPSSAFGTAGTTNCVANFITSYNGGASAVPPGPGYNCGGVSNRVLLGATYDSQSFKKTTYRAAVDFKLTEQNLLYASYSTGFRSGGFNSGQALAAVRTFLPETVKAVEVGSKNRFLGNRLQLNAAAFINKYKNLQEQRQIPFGATTISTIFNAAEAEAKGVEVELQFAPNDNFSLGGTLSILDAKYTNFPDVALPFGTSILVSDASQLAPTVVNGVTIAPAGQRRVFAPGYTCGLVPGTGGSGQPGAAFGCDLTGKKVPYAPDFQGSVYASYDFQLAGGGQIRPLIAVTFSDEFFGQPTNASLERQKSFAKLDFKLTWDVNDRLSAQAYIDNLTDEQTLNRFVWGGGGALQVSAAPPRLWGLRVSYRN